MHPDDKPWFVATEACIELGLERTESAFRGLVSMKKGAPTVSTLGCGQ
jgi:prophage antirepressor-like protein